MRDRKDITFIGFSKKDRDVKYYHCSIHQGSRLIPYTGEEGLYLCVECGIPYNPSEVKSDTHITSKFSTIQGQKQIISGKNRHDKDKEYYDLGGQKLPKDDPDILNDLAQGHTIVSYHTTEQIRKDNKDFSYMTKRWHI